MVSSPAGEATERPQALRERRQLPLGRSSFNLSFEASYPDDGYGQHRCRSSRR
ncbi:hypothetical protein RHECNPAF_1360035 [Rhizobium etli CNPAF512]|nr:hypothetical protein RHECNPAF_1360035 [Rhizobium etli CNPAF512]